MRLHQPLLLLLALALLLGAISCGDDDDNGVAPNSPPTVPVIDTAQGGPADGATGVSRTVVLRWIATDPDGDQLAYDVYFGTEEDPHIVAGNLPDPEYPQLVELAGNVTYYWRVVAKDDDGERTSSPVWSFTTGA